MKKYVKQPSVSKKATARKPMMKKGGPAKRLKRYQDEGEVSPPMSAPETTPTPTTTSKRTFADAYQANLAAGLNKTQAKKIAMRELGLKTAVDPNAIINAVGNTAGAIGSAVNAFRQPSGPSGSPFKKGGATKAKMAKGGNFAPNRAVKSSCKQGMVRDASGKCVMVRKMAKGGSTSLGMKSVKAGFDSNPKVTRADIITAAKKKKGGMVRTKKK
jgi:hypothetical protein